MSHLELIASTKTSHIVVGLMTRLKVSSKSMSGTCVYPFATKWGFNRSIIPSSLYLVLWTHFEPMTLALRGRGTKVMSYFDGG